MKLLLALAAIIFVACTNAAQKEAEEVQLNPAMLELVGFVSDSLTSCGTWLVQDYRSRSFFEDDSAAQLLTENFTHDQIIAWFQSIDTTNRLHLGSYLTALHKPFVAHKDSIRECATAINSVAFSHGGTEAVLLLVKIAPTHEEMHTLLLERASAAERWYVADTLAHSVAPN